MTIKEKTKFSLLKEIDRILHKNGKSFNSAVREYHGVCCDSDEYKDESKDEADRWVNNFKKYRLRINEKTKGKPYYELSKFLGFLKKDHPIHPQPLLTLVEDNDDPICKEMKDLSSKIYQQITEERENSEP